jgi:hypothetical protein
VAVLAPWRRGQFFLQVFSGAASQNHPFRRVTINACHDRTP